MSKWAPPLELAAVSWLGDWRPSTILQFLFMVEPVGAVRALPQLINNIHIDKEMTEIQANCALHLPFGPNGEGHGSDLVSIRSSGLSKISWRQSEGPKTKDEGTRVGCE